MANAHIRDRRAEAGFSMIEILVVVMLVGIVSSMAVGQVQHAVTAARADSVASQLASALRYGRDAAIAQRRSIDVRFTAPNRITLVRNDRPSGTTEIATRILENGGRFEIRAGVPDTPDGFGVGSSIAFNGAATIRFQPDGTFTDGASIPVNGTVYIAIPNQPLSQRAVTVTGTTARTQPYRWNGRIWDRL
jgi:prepilin-type N-terminal cleavage/methylation domain-containing protein